MSNLLEKRFKNILQAFLGKYELYLPEVLDEEIQ